jgi:hypothetical protein
MVITHNREAIPPVRNLFDPPLGDAVLTTLTVFLCATENKISHEIEN